MLVASNCQHDIAVLFSYKYRFHELQAQKQIEKA